MSVLFSSAVSIFYIVLYGSTCVFSRLQHSADSTCIVQAHGWEGVCRPLNECEDAVTLIHYGIKPQICRYENNTMIVCCCERFKQTKMKRSVRMCQEYIREAESNEIEPSIDARILGGTPNEKSEFPHMAIIGYGTHTEKKWLCGGSLLSDRYVLTAAHCVFLSRNGEAQWIHLGLMNKNNMRHVQDFNIDEIIVHPDYKPPSVYNDIALMRTDRPARFSPIVRPVCLHSGNDLLETQAIATGWGLLEFEGNPSDDLHKVTLDVFTIERCNEVYRTTTRRRLKNGIMPETQLCYGSPIPGEDTCQGDSGGPLQVKLGDSCCLFSLVGVTSFGKVCGTPNVPGVYTRVSHFVPWIENIVWPTM